MGPRTHLACCTRVFPAQAVFGVLYTLSKEKLDASKRFAVGRLLLDFIQCFILIVRPTYGAATWARTAQQ